MSILHIKIFSSGKMQDDIISGIKAERIILARENLGPVQGNVGIA